MQKGCRQGISVTGHQAESEGEQGELGRHADLMVAGSSAGMEKVHTPGMSNPLVQIWTGRLYRL